MALVFTRLEAIVSLRYGDYVLDQACINLGSFRPVLDFRPPMSPWGAIPFVSDVFLYLRFRSFLFYQALLFSTFSYAINISCSSLSPPLCLKTGRY